MATYVAETEVRSEGLTLQKIRAEMLEAFLKEPQWPALGILWIDPEQLRGI